MRLSKTVSNIAGCEKNPCGKLPTWINLILTIKREGVERKLCYPTGPSRKNNADAMKAAEAEQEKSSRDAVQPRSSRLSETLKFAKSPRGPSPTWDQMPYGRVGRFQTAERVRGYAIKSRDFGQRQLSSINRFGNDCSVPFVGSNRSRCSRSS